MVTRMAGACMRYGCRARRISAEPRPASIPSFRPGGPLSVQNAELGVRPAKRAGGDTFGEPAKGLIAVDAAGSLARRVAALAMDVHGIASAEAHLDEPVRGGRPGLLAVAPLGLAPFFGGDPSVDLLDLLHGDAAGEAQHAEARDRAIVHTFDTTSAVATLIAGQETPVNVTDLLRSLALDPADLKPAPHRPANAQDAAERLGPEPLPCAACGTPARSTRIIDTADHGRRWLDLCRDCMLATADRRRPTVPLAATLDVLRDAAKEAGVTVRVLVDPPQGA